MELRRWLATFTVGAAVLVWPATSLTVAAEPSPEPLLSARTPGPATQVVLVSIDGLRSPAIRALGPERAPTLHRLIDEGASTLNARTAVESTSTMPNHTSLLTGRRVAEGGGGHGVWINHDDGRTVHAMAGGYVTSILDVVVDAGGTTAVYANKDKFALFRRTWRRHGAGGSKLDRYVLRERQRAVIRRFTRDVSAGRTHTLSLVHLALPDVTGHRDGFRSRSYLRSVELTDRHLGRLLARVENSSLGGRTALIVTSDHGAVGVSHRDPTKVANYRVPFLVWGPEVPAGRNLYRMNQGYANPGRTRPSYAARPAPVRNGAAANVAASLLGLAPVSGSELGRDLRVTRR
ncbi:alkaline phosphatase family protein [Nocardioides limicola]|uniref:alkaline phosphatase family protein n=1 Tax=Nocardioides limicola TaxID=2803368 RepID=UPI00193C488D|nr:alkaline phosphatase family protein [Nocardioides sp. DJM-14]